MQVYCKNGRDHTPSWGCGQYSLKRHVILWGVILEGFFALNSMVMVILTSDLSLTFKSRSKVTKGHVVYVFGGEDSENLHHFDL
jgi:hypothetical protein